MTAPLTPGLLVLHGNRLEYLRDAVFDWLARHPLDPLEQEHFLVQSNGAAEWLKMSLARSAGICAATRVELPGRFLWRAYRQVLGRQRVQPQSALERNALTWRLMRLLPSVVGEATFEPIAAFLSGGDLDRRLQLARRLADLYDQYQVYRADWLSFWERGRPMLPTQDHDRDRVPTDQRWQVSLWKAIVAELSRDERASTRPNVHRTFLDALASGAPPAEPLPRRIVLFGASHVSVQALDALAALSARAQVILAVPNPCRYHWADIIDGREAMRASRRRMPDARSRDLSSIPLDAMHLHAHPLLAAWGRQGRDFMRLLDAFDDAEQSRRRFDLPRIDLFDDDPGTTMLAQVQAAIRDLVPLAEHPVRMVSADDRSFVFQVAHGAQREVEILQDQLLTMLADRDHPLDPRDIVVMVPDIETFAPSIRAVFGQYRRDDARYIPFDIADLRSRRSNPLVVALEWLLCIPEKRVRLQEVRDLLDVPAVAARFAISPEALPAAFAWLSGAGVRWGLHEDHRAGLGLGAAGAQNSWLFGLRRMLLGYASGDAASFAGVDPYDEIGGLDASTVGALAALFERLDEWWSMACGDATPSVWAARARTLLAATMGPTDEREKLTVAALQSALATWLEACDAAGFVEPIPLAVMREAWLDGLDGLDAGGRFLAGGVTFCTLMPLRSVPFEVVCLLGMNDGDFPRRIARSDFDLMALPGQSRPGDRSRRDDDRYLMLEALLSARRTLYVGWSGRSARDNTPQPPSVLVAQLCEYLDAKWRDAADGSIVAARTTVHPLQPFSRRYFEGTGLSTYAREWRAAHAGGSDATSTGPASITSAIAAFDPPDGGLTVRQLVRFLKNPVKAFFRARLDVALDDDPDAVDDDEAFGLMGLTLYQAREALVQDPDAALRDGVDATVARRLARLQGAGVLPMFESGRRAADGLRATTVPMLQRWIEHRRRFAELIAPLALRIELAAGCIDDRQDGLYRDGSRTLRLALTPSRLFEKNGVGVRVDRLVETWIHALAASACDHAIYGVVIGADAVLTFRSPEPAAARDTLAMLVQTWRDGMDAPLPFAIRTALARLADGGRPASVYEGDARSGAHAEGSEFCLARVYPDFAALSASGAFTHHVDRVFAPLVAWVNDSVDITAADDGADDGVDDGAGDEADGAVVIATGDDAPDDDA